LCDCIYVNEHTFQMCPQYFALQGLCWTTGRASSWGMLQSSDSGSQSTHMAPVQAHCQQSAHLFAMTSFAFMLLCVPLPVCQITRGKWLSSFPAATSVAAFTTASPIFGSNTPWAMLTCADTQHRAQRCTAQHRMAQDNCCFSGCLHHSFTDLWVQHTLSHVDLCRHTAQSTAWHCMAHDGARQTALLLQCLDNSTDNSTQHGAQQQRGTARHGADSPSKPKRLPNNAGGRLKL
jgi:hypothetical protein